MDKREKVLNDLQELCEHLFHEYKVCYKGDEEDTYNRFLAANNALNLLKEQQETIELQGSLLTLAHVAMSHGKKEGTRDIARPGRNRENPASHS